MLIRIFAAFGSLAPYIVAFFLGSSVTYSQLNKLLVAPLDKTRTQQESFEVEKGATPRSVAIKLAERNLIRNPYSIRLADWSKRQTGAKEIRFGEYLFAASMTPTQILEKLYSGDVVYHEVTIPEGTRVADFPALLSRTTLVTSAEVEAVLTDPALIAKLQVPSTTFEGFLFPNTYKFTRPITAEEMITSIVNEAKKNVAPEFFERAAALNLSPLEVVTLASIIEKETAVAEERPLVSSVFHNRLKSGMQLQSDPTVIYGISNFDGNITKEHLNTAGPYNTYINIGLPPTPICNPGSDAVKAALFPASTDYLFFVAKGDGTHAFSESYKEHKANVDKYIRKRS